MQNKRAEALLAVLVQYAPSASAHQACANLYSDASMQALKDHEDKDQYEKAIEITMAGAILDGLRYGNWPWTSPPGVSAHEGHHIPDLEKGPF